MKTSTIRKSSSPLRAASSQWILSGLIAAAATFVPVASSFANGELNINPIAVDGRFTNAPEWSEINPDTFFSNAGGTAFPLGLGKPVLNPLANTQLFVTIATDSFGVNKALLLCYDFLPRTPASPIGPGEVFAKISFSLHVPTGKQLPFEGQEKIVDVLFQGITSPGPSFFDIFVDLDPFDPNNIPTPASTVGLFGSAGFGPSALSPLAHLIVELEVGLRIPAGFGTPGGPLPGGGINPATGLYDPDPIFWGASGAGNGTAGGPGGGGAGGPLQSATGAMIQILPSGQVLVIPVPEPTSAALLLAGLGAFAARRRRQMAA